MRSAMASRMLSALFGASTSLWLAACPGADPGDAGPAEGVDAGPQDTDGGLVDGDAGVSDSGPMPRQCGALPSGVTEGRLGEDADVVRPARRLVVLMGGSVEVDPAAKRFAEAAGGGDLLVLRASGAVDTYTPWFHDELGADPALASTATLRIDDPAAGGEDAVRCRAEAAEALWLAGGDQWDYVGRWPASLQRVIGAAADRGTAIGGTSAGAMVLGEGAFDAEEGSVSSGEALDDPLASFVSLQTPATAQPELAGMLVDTHFSERDREGRLIAFLAAFRMMTGRDEVIGIGLDERASLVIEDGQAEVIADPTDRRVRLYRLAGELTVVEGSPLGAATVARRTLAHGDQLAWPPPAFDPADVETLQVTEGVLSVVDDGP